MFDVLCTLIHLSSQEARSPLSSSRRRGTTNKNMQQQLFNTKRTCTCKNILWNLSTNTAAEYGDLGAIIRRYTTARKEGRGESKNKTDTSSSSSSTSRTSYEPLHLAAQHGHLAVVSFLLQQGFHPDYGTTTILSQQQQEQRISSPSSSSTPLHRACFSGAVGCVKLLLEHGADITAKDGSFGDGMTPLHKAVKGGRYLAVAVIVHHYQNRTNQPHHHRQQKQQQHILDEIINDRDSQNRTPLELARELDSKGQDEILSLRRWDKVAGGTASFQKCIEILEQHIKTKAGAVIEEEEEEESTTSYTGGTTTVAIGIMPNSTTMIDFSKIVNQHSRDPKKEDDTHDVFCTISQWEREFMGNLLQSIQATVDSSTDYNRSVNGNSSTTNSTIPTEQHAATTTTTTKTVLSNTQQTVGGQPCHNCGIHSLALYRSKSHHDQLLCPKCFRQRQRQRQPSQQLV